MRKDSYKACSIRNTTFEFPKCFVPFGDGVVGTEGGTSFDRCTLPPRARELYCLGRGGLPDGTRGRCHSCDGARVSSNGGGELAPCQPSLFSRKRRQTVQGVAKRRRGAPGGVTAQTDHPGRWGPFAAAHPGPAPLSLRGPTVSWSAAYAGWRGLGLEGGQDRTAQLEGRQEDSRRAPRLCGGRSEATDHPATNPERHSASSSQPSDRKLRCPPAGAPSRRCDTEQQAVSRHSSAPQGCRWQTADSSEAGAHNIHAYFPSCLGRYQASAPGDLSHISSLIVLLFSFSAHLLLPFSVLELVARPAQDCVEGATWGEPTCPIERGGPGRRHCAALHGFAQRQQKACKTRAPAARLRAALAIRSVSIA